MSDALHDSPRHDRLGPRGSFAILQERHEALLAALDALVVKWAREGAASRIYAKQLASEVAKYSEPR